MSREIDGLVGPRDLQLGDVVRLGPGPFMDGIVKRITKTHVTIDRPYMGSSYVIAGFPTDEPRIIYLGCETVEYALSSKVRLELLGTNKIRAR